MALALPSPASSTIGDPALLEGRLPRSTSGDTPSAAEGERFFALLISDSGGLELLEKPVLDDDGNEGG